MLPNRFNRLMLKVHIIDSQVPIENNRVLSLEKESLLTRKTKKPHYQQALLARIPFQQRTG